jgi:rubrerythrin
MEKNFESSQTYLNLKKAFEEEAALYFRYKFFLIVAEYEGLDKVSKVLRDFSEGSLDNVHGNLDFMRHFRDPSSNVPIGNSEQNIKSILQTEIEQSSQSFPGMAKIAREEGFTDVASWFDTLEKLKRVHVSTLKELKEDK